MRIGFEAKRAFFNSSGLGNYSRTLIASLLEYFPENKFFAFTPAVKNSIGNDLRTNPQLNVILPSPFFQGFLSSWWRSSLMSEDIRERNLDIFHGLSNELPKNIPAGTKKVVTIHDLIFLRHPEWYPFIDRNIYYRKFRKAAKQADAVVAVSMQTKQDLVYYFNILPEKIQVIYQSCDRRFEITISDESLQQFRMKNSLPDRFILYVGTVEERKNLLCLLKAMKSVPGIGLVVVGAKKKYFEKISAFIQAEALASRVFFPESVSPDELPFYYRCAEVLVYPSFYEGFGIPIIEALSCGLPVIASGRTAMPEAGGPSSLYFDPENEDELAEKLSRVLSDVDLRNKMVAGGYDYVSRFHPRETAGQTMELYKRLANAD